MKPGYHSIVVALATGPLVLAFLAASFRFWFKPKALVPKTVWSACDSLALYGALFGMFALILAILSGIMLRPMEALLNSPITKNKILTSVLMLTCWASWLAIRIKAGPRLWEIRGFVGHFTYVMALAGFVFLVTTNSIGGDLSGMPSGYEQIGRAMGFRTRHALYFPTPLNVALWLIGLVALASAVWRRRAAKK